MLVQPAASWQSRPAASKIGAQSLLHQGLPSKHPLGLSCQAIPEALAAACVSRQTSQPSDTLLSTW